MALTWALTGFLFLAVSYFGWGRLAWRLLRVEPPERTEAAVTILLGWAFSLFVLQLLHFGVAIRDWVAIPVFVAGMILSVPRLRQIVPRARGTLSGRVVAIAVCFVAVCAWIASRGMYPVENFDSGLYHIPTIRWINEYAVVPGLGNLHGRLAFNQSFFTYAAAINAAWFSDNTRSAANGFLYLVLVLQVTQALWTRSRRGAQDKDSPAYAWAGYLFVAPLLIYLALSSEGFSSPTPDFAATLLQLSMFLIFARGVGDWKSKAYPPHWAAIVLPIFAATAITVKLSTLAFSAAILAACVLYEVHLSNRESDGRRRIFLSLAPATIIIVLWLLRGIILSGCPLYPSTVACFPVDWAIPMDKVVNEANWVYSWAREPGIPWRIVLADWRWLGSWTDRETRDLIGFAFPLASSATLTIAAVAVRRYAAKKTLSKASRSDFIILLPVVLGVLFWFCTAPDPRFGRAFFWMMSISGAVILLVSLSPLLNARSFRIAAAALFVGINAPFFAYMAARGGKRAGLVSTSGWQPLPRARLEARTTGSGLVLYVPTNGERCWNAPLTCTPYFNHDLALRVRGRLDRGFVDNSPSSRGLSPPSP